MPEAYCTKTELALTEANPPRPTVKAGPLVAGVAFSSNTVLPASANKPNEAPLIWAYTVSEAANRAVRLEPVATICEPVLLKPTLPLKLTKSLTATANPIALNSVVPAAIPSTKVNRAPPTSSARFTAMEAPLVVYRTRTAEAETPPTTPNCAVKALP